MKTSLFGKIVAFFRCFSPCSWVRCKEKESVRTRALVFFLLEFARFFIHGLLWRTLNLCRSHIFLTLFNSPRIKVMLEIWLQCYEWKTHTHITHLTYINDDLTVVDSTNNTKMFYEHTFQALSPHNTTPFIFQKWFNSSEFIHLFRWLWIHEMIGKKSITQCLAVWQQPQISIKKITRLIDRMKGELRFGASHTKSKKKEFDSKSKREMP